MTQSSIVDDFISRLRQAERSRDPQGLTEVFSPDADLQNLTRPADHFSFKGTSRAHSAPPSATQFWRQYLQAFATIQSEFTDMNDFGGFAVLEWKSSGKLSTGLPIEYNGVSLLEYGDGKIHRFRTYYDSAAFLPHRPAAKPYSESVGLPELTTGATS